MEKKLIKFNGRSCGSKYPRGTFYIAAYSTAEAARLYEQVVNSSGVSEIRTYYHKGQWGNRMNGIEPEYPCIYYSENWNGTPKLILTLKNKIYEQHN